MLGKLLKHEWKDTWKVGCLMLIGLLLVTFFGWLSFQAPMWQSIANNSRYNRISVWDLVSFGTLFLYIILLIGINFGILIYLAVHFYQTMYTDRGYLTHTLPVSKHQLLVSKILNSGIWMIIVFLGMYLSLFVLGASMIGAFIPDGYTWSDIWNEMGPYWGVVNDSFREIFGVSAGGYFTIVLITSLISPFCSMIIIFGAISIGQLVSKHRVLMAIVSYIGISVVNSILNSILQSINSVSQFDRLLMDDAMANAAAGRYVTVTMFSSLAISIVEAVILYFVSYHVTSKKLNME